MIHLATLNVSENPRVVIEQVWKILDQQDKRKQKRDKRLLILNVSRLLDNDCIDYRNLVIKTNCFEQST